jgi:hypothetical protein
MWTLPNQDFPNTGGKMDGICGFLCCVLVRCCTRLPGTEHTSNRSFILANRQKFLQFREALKIWLHSASSIRMFSSIASKFQKERMTEI